MMPYSNSGGYAAPPGYSLANNIATARAYFDTHSFSDSMSWFYNQVRNGGPWDYKQQSSSYEGLGNFNYGAVGAAVGLSENLLKRAAGWAQGRAGTSNSKWGNWWGSPPYGDDPADQNAITNGIEWSKNIFHFQIWISMKILQTMACNAAAKYVNSKKSSTNGIRNI
jgi:hypothetical protein